MAMPYPRCSSGKLWGFLLILTAVFVCRANGINDYSQSIFRYAKMGDLTAVKARVEQNPALVRQTHGGNLTPLHYAAWGGQPEVIDYLIAQGAELETRDELGRTPLHTAAFHSHPTAVEHLLAHNADVNADDDDGNTPLHSAVLASQSRLDDASPEEQKELFKTVKLLVTAGANVDACNDGTRTTHDDGETPLHIAAEGNLPQVIEYLIDVGAELEARDFDGRTPLLRAAESRGGSFEALKTLVRLGADPMARVAKTTQQRTGVSALSLAARRGNLKTIKFLLKENVPVQYDPKDLKHSEPFEYSALYDAIQFSHLILGGKDKKQQLVDQLAVIDLLAREAGSINSGVRAGSYRGTALALAVRHDSPYVVRHIIENYPESYTREDIRAAIADLRTDGIPESRRERERYDETLKLLRNALEAKRQEK